MGGKYAAFFVAAALLFLNVVVPPFQSPDEPHHFAAAVLYARGEAGRDAVESGVIGMMDRANWWRLVGIGRPSPLPGRIAEIRVFDGRIGIRRFPDAARPVRTLASGGGGGVAAVRGLGPGEIVLSLPDRVGVVFGGGAFLFVEGDWGFGGGFWAGREVGVLSCLFPAAISS